jgi:hypothetical protein
MPLPAARSLPPLLLPSCLRRVACLLGASSVSAGSGTPTLGRTFPNGKRRTGPSPQSDPAPGDNSLRCIGSVKGLRSSRGGIGRGGASPQNFPDIVCDLLVPPKRSAPTGGAPGFPLGPRCPLLCVPGAEAAGRK